MAFPFLLAGAAAAGAYFFFFKKDDKPKDMAQTYNGVTIDPRLAAIPQFAALPPAQQAQLAAILQNGSRAQLLQMADYIEKTGGPSAVAALFRMVAATKA